MITRPESAARPAPARRRFFSLRLRLLAPCVLIVLVPWLALVLYTQSEERKAAIAQVNGDALRLTRIVTSNPATQVEAARQLLTAFARLPQLRAENAAACNAFLAEMLTAYPLYLNFAVVAPDGRLVCSAVPIHRAVNVADRGYFRSAMATRPIRDRRLPDRAHQPAAVDHLRVPGARRGGRREAAVVIAAQSLRWLTGALSNLEFPRARISSSPIAKASCSPACPSPRDWIGKVLPDPRLLATLASRKDGGVFQADDPQGSPPVGARAGISGQEPARGDRRARGGGFRRSRPAAARAISSGSPS